LRPLARALGLVLAAAAALLPRAAGAFCRQTTADDDTCGTNPGTPLFWKGNCLEFSINQAGSDDLPIDVVEDNIRRSFVPWHNATRVGEQSPCTYMTFLESELAICDKVEYNADAGNMNLVVFRESGWTSQLNHARASMGLTTVLFDPKTGEILSADMELNGEFFHFTVDNVNVDADLRNTATHEAGHMLGLAHSPLTEATMYGSSVSGEVKKATLESDDIEGVCTMYPIAQDPGFCAEPPGGLDTTCKPGSSGCGCRLPGEGGRGEGWMVALLGFGGCVMRRRRRATPAR
jgi:MYXO-CTERM domain-containing protein